MQTLLAFLRKTETNKRDPATYDTIIGNNQVHLGKPLTQYTLQELLAEQPTWPKKFGVTSGAAGAYQIINRTLKGLVNDLNIPLTNKFSIELQDKFAIELVRRRGWEEFINGKISVTQFGNNLAREWASMPVLSPQKRGSITLKRGQSYYDKVAGNSALVSAITFEALLQSLVRPASSTVAPTLPPRPIPTSTLPPAAKPKFDPFGWLKGNKTVTNVTSGDVVEVEVKSAWLSKTNLTQFLSVLAMVGTLFGFQLDAATQVQIISVILSLSAFITWLLRTFFTTSVTPSSAKKL